MGNVRWPEPDGRARVGFVGPCYQVIGGTETWHRGLLPRLTSVQVVGYAVERTDADAPDLGSPLGVGWEAMASLAASVDLLVVWGLGANLADVIPDPRPRVVWVSHGDDAIWAGANARDVLRFADRYVGVSVTAAAVCPASEDVIVIPNGVDPARVRATRLRRDVRDELGIPLGASVAGFVGRLSCEKRPWLVTDAVNVADVKPDAGYLCFR